MNLELELVWIKNTCLINGILTPAFDFVWVSPEKAQSLNCYRMKDLDEIKNRSDFLSRIFINTMKEKNEKRNTMCSGYANISL